MNIGRTKTTSTSAVVCGIVFAIVPKRPLGGNARGCTIRMTTRPWLVGFRANTVSLAVQVAPTGNIIIELWSEIIIIRLMQ
jgi:hypothetical protein